MAKKVTIRVTASDSPRPVRDGFAGMAQPMVAWAAGQVVQLQEAIRPALHEVEKRMRLTVWQIGQVVENERD